MSFDGLGATTGVLLHSGDGGRMTLIALGDDIIHFGELQGDPNESARAEQQNPRLYSRLYEAYHFYALPIQTQRENVSAIGTTPASRLSMGETMSSAVCRADDYATTEEVPSTGCVSNVMKGFWRSSC